MTPEQAEIIIKLICIEAAIASHHQTPPRDWIEECSDLRKELRNSTEESK